MTETRASYRAVLPTRPRANKDGQNARVHWRTKASRAKTWRHLVGLALAQADWPETLPDNGRGYTVTLTIKQQRGPLFDDDGAVGCCKAIRDAIAQFCGVTDDPSGPSWVYKTERGPDGLRIEMEATT